MAPNENEINDKFIIHKHRTREPSESEDRFKKTEESREKREESQEENYKEERRKRLEDRERRRAAHMAKAEEEISRKKESEKEFIAGPCDERPCDELRKNLEKINDEAIIPIAKKLNEEGEEDLSVMFYGKSKELDTAIKICPFVDSATCTRANENMKQMNLMNIIRKGVNLIKGTKETLREKLPSLCGVLQHSFDKLAELSAGTPLQGVFSNLKKICGMTSAASRFL